MITPAVNFNFVAATLDPRITFARAGATATRVNASGLIETVAADTARFDFNPTTLVCRGLLIEETRTNLLLGSEDFATYWLLGTGGSISSNAAVSPDGTQNADAYTWATSTNSYAFLRQTVSAASNVANTFSIFLKRPAGSGSRSVRLTVTDVTTSTTNSSNFTVTESWQRFTFTRTSASSTGQVGVGLVAGTAGTNPIVAGEVLHVWGGQLEAGAFATSYIPTTTTAVTRNADVATITGTNFSNWWQSSKGGVLVRARPGTVSGVRPWLQFDDGTANEIIALRGNTTNPELYIVDGGTPQAQIDAGTIAANTDYSLTGWWATNDCKARLDSGAVVTDTSATIPTVTQARLGSDGTNYLNGHLATINYYDSFFGQPIYTRRKNKVFQSLF